MSKVTTCQKENECIFICCNYIETKKPKQRTAEHEKIGERNPKILQMEWAAQMSNSGEQYLYHSGKGMSSKKIISSWTFHQFRTVVSQKNMKTENRGVSGVQVCNESLGKPFKIGF